MSENYRLRQIVLCGKDRDETQENAKNKTYERSGMIDKKNRVIDIRYSSDPIEVAAYDGDHFAGEFKFEEMEDGPIKLYYLNMEEGYEGCGIAAEMLKEALNKLGKFTLPKPVSQKRSADDGDWLSEQAEGFICHCVSKHYCTLVGRLVTPYAHDVKSYNISCLKMRILKFLKKIFKRFTLYR